MTRGSGHLAALLAARCVVEGVLFTALASLVHAATQGERPVPAVAVALALAGGGTLFGVALRRIGGTGWIARAAVAVIAAAAIAGVLSAPAGASGITILTRLILFGILGEAFVWRNASVASSLTRWRAARDATGWVLAVLAIAAIAPGPIDRAGLTVAGLAAIVAAGVALSLARTVEELTLAGQEARGAAGRAAPSSVAILLGLLALAGAPLTPLVGDRLGELGAAAAPIAGRILFALLLPLGYIAAFVVEVVRALFRGASFPQLARLAPPLSAEEEAEALRRAEATRPWVIGGVEIVLAGVAVLVALVLIERLMRERPASMPSGATLEREPAIGEGLGPLLAALLPRPRRRARPPLDDGTPAGALRALYWRFLTRADAAGIAWRASGETPAEHHRRAAEQDPRFERARGLVRAFEDLRYGQRDPDRATVAGARAALAAIDEAR